MWYLYLDQGNGCDYTIGCGKKLIGLCDDKHTKDEAMQAAKNYMFDEDEGLPIDDIETVALLFVKDEENLPLGTWKTELKQQREQARLKQEEDAEKAEYERLKKKLGK